ncbi:MAG: hypothetical protein B7Z22_00440 [Hyphomonas sp. 32-62-5]|nr:MAG: hypothetical protein B7Z22_00440 [Hyphomonas sp. 32-62-5]
MSTADVSSPTATSEPPSNWRLVAFSSTGFGKSLFWSAADIFCLVFATDTLGLDPALAGAVVLVTLIWDAVSDPIVGLLVDRFPRLHGTYGLTIMFAGPMTAIFLSLVFTAQFSEGVWQSVIFVVGLLLFRTAFTFFDIPDNALFCRIARSDTSRIFGASTRKLMATLAAVAVSISSSWVFSDNADLTEGVRILLASCVIGIVGSLALILGAATVRRWDKLAPVTSLPRWPSLKAIIGNSAVLRLCLHMFFSSLSMAAFMVCLVYHSRFILGDGGWFATSMTIFLVGQAVGVVAWGWYAVRHTAEAGLRLAGSLAVLAAAMFFAAPSAALSIAVCSFFGFCAGGLNTLRWAIAPAAIEMAKLENGQQNEAAIIAIFTLSIKAAIGFASLVVGGALSLSAYFPNAVATDSQATTFMGIVGAVCLTSMFAATMVVVRRSAR